MHPPFLLGNIKTRVLLCVLISVVLIGLITVSTPVAVSADLATVTIKTRVRVADHNIKTLTLPSSIESLALEVTGQGLTTPTRTVHGVDSGQFVPLSTTVETGVERTFTVKAYHTSDGTGTAFYEGRVTVTITAGQSPSLRIVLSPPDVVAGSPSVMTMLPANGANVGTQPEISATFSERMRASTFTTSTFTLTHAGSPISGAVFYNVTDKKTFFTPFLPLAAGGSYTATLTTGVTDAVGNPLTSPVTWSFLTMGVAVNMPPIANAGGDASVTVGSVVILNGSDSIDLDGDPITFSWTFVSKPAGSTAALSSLIGVAPTFTPDVAGAYVFELIVNDGSVNSAVDSVTFTAMAAGPPDGTVKSKQKISETQGGFTGSLDISDKFGESVANLGDLDGDGVVDLAVGAPFDDDGGNGRGAVYVLFLNANGTVKSEQKISDTAGNFTASLVDLDAFGSAVSDLGDLDGDGVKDLAVGARSDDTGGTDFGAVYILFMNANGTVKSHQKIADGTGGFPGSALGLSDAFGHALGNLGDLDGDGVKDLAVGALLDDDGTTNKGAIYILFMNMNGTVKGQQKISSTAGGFDGSTVPFGGRFGSSVANIGDLDGDGVKDVAVGSLFDTSATGGGQGAVYILFMNINGTVKGQQKISGIAGGFTGPLTVNNTLGSSVAGLGDLDGDGVEDIAVGASGDDDGPGINAGALYVLFLNTNGTVKAEQKISSALGGLSAPFTPLGNTDSFGTSAASLGDLDGDGIVDLAIGANGDDDGGGDQGAMYILFLK